MEFGQMFNDPQICQHVLRLLVEEVWARSDDGRKHEYYRAYECIVDAIQSVGDYDEPMAEECIHNAMDYLQEAY